jgi:hypothetical protein
MMGLEEFHLEGLMARAKTWKNLVSGILGCFIRYNCIVRRKRAIDEIACRHRNRSLLKKAKHYLLIMCKKKSTI